MSERRARASLCLAFLAAASRLAASDPPKAQTVVSAYVFRETILSTKADQQGTTGAMVDAQLGVGRYALAGRLVATALPGEDVSGNVFDAKIYRAVEGYLNATAIVLDRGDFQLGPSCWLGSSVGYDLQGVVLKTPHPFTAGCGVAISSPSGAWARAGAGVHGLIEDPWSIHLAAVVPLNKVIVGMADGGFGQSNSWIRGGVSIVIRHVSDAAQARKDAGQ